jgi:hypothetical protein
MRKFYNEELYDLYFSPDLIMVIKSRSMEWAGPGREDNAQSVKGWGLRRKETAWKEDNKMKLQEIGSGAWSRLIRLRI